ncbi:hypothetical protein Tco_0110544 [Tanacetum coccineum]
MENPFPPNHANDLPEVDPVQPDITPVIPEPAPLVPEHALPEEEEDLEEEEFEEEEEPQEEEELEDEMDMDLNDQIDDPEVIYPYEVEDGDFLPPSGLYSEPKDVTVPTGRSTLQLLPPVRIFLGKFYVEEGSSVATIISDVERYMKEFDFDLRDEMQCRNKLEQNMITLEDQVQDLVHGEREENKKLTMAL